jgi:hypothetical protein
MLQRTPHPEPDFRHARAAYLLPTAGARRYRLLRKCRTVVRCERLRERREGLSRPQFPRQGDVSPAQPRQGATSRPLAARRFHQCARSQSRHSDEGLCTTAQDRPHQGRRSDVGPPRGCASPQWDTGARRSGAREKAPFQTVPAIPRTSTNKAALAAVTTEAG